MELLQLGWFDLDTLIESEAMPYEIHALEGAVPPKHVLLRSIELSENSVAEIWALPYFIQNGQIIVGCCGFKRPPENREVEIGYNVAPSVRGMGVATSAVKQLCKNAFDSGDVNRVIALINPDNKASLSVVSKSGFLFHKVVSDDDGEQLERWVIENVPNS